MTAMTQKPNFVMLTGAATVDDADATLRHCWSAHNHVPGHIRMQLGIAVAELVANIVEHAAEGESARVQMSIEVLANEVHVSFTDDGAPCTVDPSASQMPGEFATRGRGIAMMRAVLGALSYHRSDTHNHWRLISRRFG
jgi:serine/threonine-protein kinase RsbW